ncbi:MAG: hypothetical protein Q8S73_16985 [Deltaproteobacteria bacterium]|nr:hypothetical protein [Myxococcales bacterium]MDP3215805.1 hypothetical protein [Deltaproteobacteria bacterium]
MSFRDDREAAHRRADALEQELKRTQAELEQMRAPKRPGSGAPVALVVALVVLAAGGGAAFWTMQRGATAERSAQLAREQAAREAAMHAEAMARAEAERAAAAQMAAVYAGRGRHMPDYAALRVAGDAAVVEAAERARASQRPSFAGEVEQAGRVTAARGHAPVAAGERCVMMVRPASEPTGNCRVVLRCGTTWLYGAREMGYLTCEVQDGRPVAALDEIATNDGGDPRLDWRGQRVVVSDVTEAGEWSVELAL